MGERGVKTRIFLIDDHPLVRESLTSLIDQQPDMAVCGEAEDAAGAIKAVAAARPDIVIMDLSLKESSGLELIKQVKLRFPGVGIIVLSMHDEQLYAERCVRAGARGYVMKRESTRRIVLAIREVRSGQLCLSPQMAASFAERFVGGRGSIGDTPMESLSDRELEVFNLLGRGMETRQVAEAMHVSIKTVQAYCARIKQKLKVSTATELLREAVRWQQEQAQA